MNIKIKKLGRIDQADIKLGKLTVICGENNIGKTYITHTIYGFFEYIKNNNFINIPSNVIEQLLKNGYLKVSLLPYIENIQKILDKASESYSRKIYQILAGHENLFKKTIFKCEIGKNELIPKLIKIKFGSANHDILQITSSNDSNELMVNLLIDKESNEILPNDVINEMIGNATCDALNIMPRVFLASTERTGVAVFQRELDFTKNRLVELLGVKSAKLNPFNIFEKFSGVYPLAVRRNVDFIRSLPDIANKESRIKKEYPKLLENFSNILGGEYKVSRDKSVNFIPYNANKIKLSLVESSSSVRSLLDIGFYLNHMAASGDLLMIDEPELNLHPKNQRKVARLIAQLINSGINVFITTHSDYIIKEFNTLILFNQKDARLKEIAKRENYSEDEFLDPKMINVYIAKEASGEKKNLVKLIPAKITETIGIEVETFDDTIDEMNRIQDEILWED